MLPQHGNGIRWQRDGALAVLGLGSLEPEAFIGFLKGSFYAHDGRIQVDVDKPKGQQVPRRMPVARSTTAIS